MSQRPNPARTPETFCAEVKGVTCRQCPLRRVAELAWQDAAQPRGTTPFYLAEAIDSARLAMFDDPDELEEEPDGTPRTEQIAEQLGEFHDHTAVLHNPDESIAVADEAHQRDFQLTGAYMTTQDVGGNKLHAELPPIAQRLSRCLAMTASHECARPKPDSVI